MKTVETFGYGYDSAMRLARETRTLPGSHQTTRYKYDAVGNRKQKILDGIGTEFYSHNARYELTRVRHPDGSATMYDYDENGNTLFKSHFVPDTVIIDAQGEVTITS